jgi:hypothetical protein
MAGFINGVLITTGVSDGIRAYNYGTGDVTVNDTGNIDASYGLTTSSVNGYGDGIAASNFGPGDIYVTTAAGVIIDSAGAGISANDSDSTVPSTSVVDIVAYGTIMSGVLPTGGGKASAGILAGYNYNSSAADNVHGNVVIDDHASITAAAGTDGIRGYNYGTGNVTITVESGAVIDGPRYGVDAFGDDGGNVSVTNHGSITGVIDAVNATTTGSGVAHVDNFGSLTGDIATSAGSTITNELGATWSLDGSNGFGGSSSLTNDGTIDSNGINSSLMGLSNLTNNGTIEVKSGSLTLGSTNGIAGTGTLKIDAGTTLEIASGASSGQTVTFTDTTGKLILDDPSHFSGQIAGITGSGDVLDIAGFNAANDTVVATTTGNYNSATNTTSLVVTDDTTNATVTLKLTGDLSGSSWTVTGDGNGGADIVDPPATSQSVGPVVAHDPGPATSNTIVASAANQTLSGVAASEIFVFNFAGVGHDTVTNFHPVTDTLQFSGSIFANAQAVLNATQDDGHGNTVVALDAHDTITLSGVLKAQLHVSDFHVV